MDIRAYIESGIIESYVLGMADAQEAAELEQLAAQHPEIREAIASFEASLEASAITQATPPPPDVKAKLFSELKNEFSATVPSFTESTAKVVPLTATGSRSNFFKYLAAASVILLVVSSGMNFYFYNRLNDATDKLLALQTEHNSILADNKTYQTRLLDIYSNMQLMSDPQMIKVSMPGIKGKENNLATVFWDSKTKDVYLLANKLAQAPENKQYQLWAIVNGKPVDAGLLNDCNGLCKLKNIPAAQAFAITLEKKGGSPTPTLDQMFVLGKVSG